MSDGRNRMYEVSDLLAAASAATERDVKLLYLAAARCAYETEIGRLKSLAISLVAQENELARTGGST